MTWKDINMEQFVQLQKALTRKYRRPEQKTFALANIVFGKDIQQEPVADLPHYYAELEELLNDSVPDIAPNSRYILNSREYVFHREIEKMTTAQYIDFTNLSKEPERNMIKTLAVFLIPFGHKYNDGYDIEEVRHDIGTALNAVEGNAILFFLIARSRDFMKRSVYYSLAQIMMAPKVAMKTKWRTCRQLFQGWRNLERSIML